MNFDYSKLKGRIIEVFESQYKFAEAMGWSERTLSLKLNGKRTWTQKDICKAAQLLKIPDSKIQIYFFKLKVQNI